MNPSVARRLWKLLEPYHATVYFAEETKEAYDAAGTKGYWMGYFASRSAAMGPVGAGVVTATFFNFAPPMVRRAIPDAWSFSSPEKMLAARLQVADAALRRLLGDLVDSPGMAEAADLALLAAEAGDPAGRPLYAAHVALPAPREPHLRLWHAATCLREHRGDGHVAMLVTAGLDGCDANVIARAAGVVPETQASRRGWTDGDWTDATARLVERGHLDGEGQLTPGGVAGRDAVEAQTDLLAVRPYEVIGELGAERLVTLLEPIVRRLLDQGSMPFPNPVGVPAAF